MNSRIFSGVCVSACLLLSGGSAAAADPSPFDRSIGQLSRAHGVPERLVRRVIMRESRYAPHLTNRGHYGLMQIRLDTAKGMGYAGGAKGLLDGETNLTYAVPYLANAYLAADKNEDRAVQLYAGGYYYVAKRKGLLAQLRTARSRPLAEETQLVAYAEEPAAEPTQPSNPFAALFGGRASRQQPASSQQNADASDEALQDWALEGEELALFEDAPLPPKRPIRL